MRKLGIFILEIENESNAWEYFIRFKNSLINRKDDKLFFSSKFTNKLEEIKVLYSKLVIDEKIEVFIRDIINESYNEAKTISVENMGFERQKGSVLGGVLSVFQKYSYFNYGEADIFDLFTDVFVKIMMNHYLTSGNKGLP